MCRFLTYQGEPILIETLVRAPCHSLVSDTPGTVTLEAMSPHALAA